MLVKVSVESALLELANVLRCSEIARHNFTSTPHLCEYKIKTTKSSLWQSSKSGRYVYLSPMRSRSPLSISNRKSWYVNNSPRMIVRDVESMLLLINHSLSRRSMDADDVCDGDVCSGRRRCANSCRGDRQMPSLRVVVGSMYGALELLLMASTSVRPC